jgi:putative acetyltransferase
MNAVAPSVSLRLATSADHAELIQVWDAAVRATHHFLAEEDILFFHSSVPSALAQLNVWIAEDAARIVGFIAVSGKHIEALFIAPDQHRRGIGRRLLDHIVATHPGTYWNVDVNEQNPEATRFYLHSGFIQTGRSELDPSGRPYPLLHLVLRR